jgi:EpsI family protein
MLIERFTQRRHILDVQQFPDIAPVPRSGQPVTTLDARMLGAVGLVVVAMVGAWMVHGREEEVPARLSLATFPLHLGDWVATESSLDIETEQALGFEDYVLADYRRADGSPVNFYVAFYASQRRGVSPHSPQVCIPGGGWVISQLERTAFNLNDGSPIEVVRVVIDRANQRQIVYYWFEQRGRRIANEYWMKWYLFVDALTRNRTDGALVRVVSPVRQGESTEAVDQRIQDFIRLAEPHLDTFVPR